MCSKCNIMFNTELEYKQHYDEKHKASTSNWKSSPCLVRSSVL
jgi:hypothetical protein